VPGAVEAAPKGCELVQIPVGGPEDVALESNEAIEFPQREVDAVGEDELEVAEGLEGGELAFETFFPV
jgi:hypothetical protein